MSVRVVHFFGQLNRGGAELRTLELIRASPPDIRHDVVALSGRPGALDPQVEARGGRVYRIPLDIRLPWRLLRLFLQERYSVVHSHIHFASFLPLAVAFLAGIPVRIVHLRTTGGPSDLASRVKQTLFRHLTSLFATHVLAVSAATLRATWPNWKTDPRAQVIYNGIDLTRFSFSPPTDLNLPPGDPLLIHIGRYDPAKNHRRLFQLFATFRESHPGAHLILVGIEGESARDAINQLIDQFALTPHVTNFGTTDRVPELLSHADLMFFPSIFEGLPGAVLEACASNVPVVATDLPGIREIATSFSSVALLPLSAPDSLWCAEAQRLLQQKKQTPIRNDFSSSPFSFERCLADHVRTWRNLPP